MKAIISHDVDHLNVTEHLLKDTIIPKMFVRNSLELFTNSISFKEYRLRCKDFLKNKMQNIPELIEFDKINKIPSTFFFGMSNGLGLNYSLANAAKWVKYVESKGFSTGVHGICYQNEASMQLEYKNFKSITGQNNFGIRMHYLRYDNNLHKRLSNIGYLFDATYYSKTSSFKKNGIICFPLHLMDTYEVYRGERFLRLSFEDIIEKTKKKLMK